MNIIDRLREDAWYHRDTAHDCDCNPQDTVNWQHAINADEAADRIAELEARLEITPDCQYDGIDTRDATIKELEQRLEYFTRGNTRRRSSPPSVSGAR